MEDDKGSSKHYDDDDKDQPEEEHVEETGELTTNQTF
jgi:hypothetical protein